jgi:hypothetical protein
MSRRHHFMKMRLLAFAGLLALAPPAFGQNLIPNGDFEDLHDCPRTVGEIEIARGWHNGALTPDLFSDCTNGQDNGLNVPDTYVGTQTPASGHCFAGLVLFGKQRGLQDRDAYKITESIWTRLSAATKSGQPYRLSLYVAVADSSAFACGYLTAEFSNLPFTRLDKARGKDNRIVQVKLPAASSKWVLVSEKFVADKPYRYVKIGMSRGAFPYRYFKQLTGEVRTGDCYYFLDQLSLTKTE